MIIEVAVYNIESARKAQEGGADRIELCDNYAEGGTTPSHGLIEIVRQHVSIDVIVMIRPRGGDFYYSNEEYHVMKRDIETCKRLSVDGIALGILKPDGSLDKEKCRKLIDFARPLKVTCHRAFDLAKDPFQTLEDCIEAGFDRILTSGHHNKAIDGVPLITELIKNANGRIVIIPASGITQNTVFEIVSQTGASEIHFSATAFRESEMKFRGANIKMGLLEDIEFKVRTVDPSFIKNIRKLVKK